jgi:hypothetical protein
MLSTATTSLDHNSARTGLFQPPGLNKEQDSNDLLAILRQQRHPAMTSIWEQLAQLRKEAQQNAHSKKRCIQSIVGDLPASKSQSKGLWRWRKFVDNLPDESENMAVITSCLEIMPHDVKEKKAEILFNESYSTPTWWEWQPQVYIFCIIPFVGSFIYAFMWKYGDAKIHELGKLVNSEDKKFVQGHKCQFAADGKVLVVSSVQRIVLHRLQPDLELWNIRTQSWITVHETRTDNPIWCTLNPENDDVLCVGYASKGSTSPYLFFQTFECSDTTPNAGRLLGQHCVTLHADDRKPVACVQFFILPHQPQVMGRWYTLDHFDHRLFA